VINQCTSRNSNVSELTPAAELVAVLLAGLYSEAEEMYTTEAGVVRGSVVRVLLGVRGKSWGIEGMLGAPRRGIVNGPRDGEYKVR
jgi:hypothetical protein